MTWIHHVDIYDGQSATYHPRQRKPRGYRGFLAAALSIIKPPEISTAKHSTTNASIINAMDSQGNQVIAG